MTKEFNMNKTTKTVLILIGSVLLVCICGASVLFATGLWSVGNIVRWADTNTSENPQEVVRFGSEIADFDVPEGFGSPYGMHFGEITSVGYASQSKNTHILLTQFPEGTHVNVEEMLKLINQYSIDPDNAWVDAQTTLIEEKPVTIRGQETTLSISEGTSSDGTTYRSAVATFQGKGGPSMLMVAGPIEEWDIEMVEEFVTSVQ
jgi:hypothetical protein